MANENCLEGIKCPRCGFEDMFKIECTTIFWMSDSGEEDHGDLEFNSDSYIECNDCAHWGKVRDFYVEETDAD